MYNLVTAHIRSYDPQIGVVELDVSNQNLWELVATSSEVYLTLTSPHLESQYVLDMSNVRDLIYASDSTLTVAEWLVALGNVALPVVEGQVTMSSKRAKSMCAYAAGYSVHSSSGRLYNQDETILEEDRLHLALTRGEHNLLDMSSYVLASINGFLHTTDSDADALYVRHGSETMQVGKSPKVNLHSFANISPFVQIPLSRCTLTPRNGSRLANGVTIATGLDLTGKTVWLSIGGHLMYLNRDYTVMNRKSIALDWNKFNFKHKYLNSRGRLNLSTVDLAMGLVDGGSGILSQQSLNTDEVIRAYLELPQSFIIVFDNPTIDVDLRRIEDMSLPGKYMVKDEPHLMYMNEEGRLPPISLIDEHKNWVVSVSIENASTSDYMFTQVPSTDNDLFTDALVKADPKHRSALYTLDIKTTTINIEPL